MIVRGIRNCNPANLRDQGIAWDGLATPRSDDKGYLIFTSDLFGIRALARDIWTKYHKDGIKTIVALVNKFAPAADGNDVAAYEKALSSALGVAPAMEFELDEESYPRLLRAIVVHECGSFPYSNALLIQAINLAEPKG